MLQCPSNIEAVCSFIMTPTKWYAQESLLFNNKYNIKSCSNEIQDKSADVHKSNMGINNEQGWYT